MIVTCVNHPFRFDVENLVRAFFPFEKIAADGERSIVVETVFSEKTIHVFVKIFDKQAEETIALPEEDQDLALCVLLYRLLTETTGIRGKWGILTGVRPAKLMHKLIGQLGESAALAYFSDKLLVSEQKSRLTRRVAEAENRIIALSGEDSFSLYISIPFCPTRCSYCSFVSHSVQSAKNLIDPYVELLVREISETGRIAEDLGLRLETVYFGGGTPTTLSAPQLEQIMTAVERCFDFSSLREYTVEGGRPDTITPEKLHVLRAHGAGRISINPQSFSDNVLKAIGRNHSSQQTLEAYAMARDAGFENINMDFIAGLPEDTREGFRDSIDRAVSLGADSITVHTLAMKRAAFLVTEDLIHTVRGVDAVTDMVNYSNEKLTESGYFPYYMYRQSKSAGNLENVGWSRKDKECLYNVYMMDETHTVLAAGAGAVTKLRSPYENHIERIYNYKYPFEYIRDFDEMINRKAGISAFYETERRKHAERS